MKTATNQIFDDQFNAWREIVTGLDSTALNWKPGEDTNSIAVLVAHSCDTTRFLMACVVGAEIEPGRDRETKFQTVSSSADELLELIDETERVVGGYTNQLTAEQLIAINDRPGLTYTGSWWLLHTLEHNQEHVGQALLTRQLYEQR